MRVYICIYVYMYIHMYIYIQPIAFGVPFLQPQKSIEYQILYIFCATFSTFFFPLTSLLVNLFLQISFCKSLFVNLFFYLENLILDLSSLNLFFSFGTFR